jgi:hypothetical protein
LDYRRKKGGCGGEFDEQVGLLEVPVDSRNISTDGAIADVLSVSVDGIIRYVCCDHGGHIEYRLTVLPAPWPGSRSIHSHHKLLPRCSLMYGCRRHEKASKKRAKGEQLVGDEEKKDMVIWQSSCSS